MKAELKPITTWQPHRDKTEEEHEIISRGMLQVFVGGLFVGWVKPTTTEPEELFEFDAIHLMYNMDENGDLINTRSKRKKGKPLQEILDNVELIFKDFLNKICK